MERDPFFRSGGVCQSNEDTCGAELTEAERKLALAKKEEANLKARRRAMGNMQFVGHLYKNAMITEKIVHVCIQELLKDPAPEEVECVCKLLTTAGPYLQVCSSAVLPCPQCAGSQMYQLLRLRGLTLVSILCTCRAARDCS
jgi:hypothetical protein